MPLPGASSTLRARLELRGLPAVRIHHSASMQTQLDVGTIMSSRANASGTRRSWPSAGSSVTRRSSTHTAQPAGRHSRSHTSAPASRPVISPTASSPRVPRRTLSGSAPSARTHVQIEFRVRCKADRLRVQWDRPTSAPLGSVEGLSGRPSAWKVRSPQLSVTAALPSLP